MIIKKKNDRSIAGRRKKVRDAHNCTGCFEIRGDQKLMFSIARETA